MIKKIGVAIICLTFSSISFAQNKKIFVDEYLFYYTTKIKCTYQKNGITSEGSGTGFFFDFDTLSNSSLPVIVTNKHVIKDAIAGQFSLIRKTKDGFPDSTVVHINLNNFERYWMAHPDSSVDLCIMPIAPLLKEARKNKLEFFYIPIGRELIPTKEEWFSLKALENIKMIGYPIGMEDTKNNLPIVRSGVTATPPYYNFNGLELFLIDCPCFPGQSGSPVMVYDIGNTSDKNGMLRYGSKVYFLGILFAGPQLNAKGEIKLKNIPIQRSTHVETSIPINIGYIEKSTQLLDFEELLK